MLVLRGRPEDVFQFEALTEEAMVTYATLGMPRHVELARTLREQRQ